jgi:hypothetical protein
MTPRIPLAAVALLLTTLVLASCAQAPEAGPTVTPTVSAPAQTTAPVASDPTPAPETPAAEPTCETIISEGYVETLADLGWTPKQSDFVVGSTTVDGGIYCSWADWSKASDHGQFFAWAPMDPDQQAAAQSELLAQGWLRESDGTRVYFTEPAESAFQTDEEGYGMTYEFGDDWVTFADTKQSLVLISWG